MPWSLLRSASKTCHRLRASTFISGRPSSNTWVLRLRSRLLLVSIIESCLCRHFYAFLVFFSIGAHNTAVSAFQHAHLCLLIKFASWTVLIAQQLLLLKGHSLHVLAISLKCTIKIVLFFICFSEFPYHVEILYVVVGCHLQILVFDILSLLSNDAGVVGVL